MKNLSLAYKLGAGFGSLILIASILGTAGYVGSVKNSGAIKEIGSVRLPGVQYLEVVKLGGEQVNAAELTLLNPGLDPAIRKREHDSIATIRQNYDQAWKAYEALPKTAEEAALWKGLGPAWGEWRKDNTEFFRLSKELEDYGLGDPRVMHRQLEQFRAEHHRLQGLGSEMTRDKQAISELEDAAQCSFSKWRAATKVQNRELQEALAKSEEPHTKFHESLKKIKERAQAGDAEGASSVYRTELTPSAIAMFQHFQRMITPVSAAETLLAKVEVQAIETCRVTRLKANDILDQLIRLTVENAGKSGAFANQQASYTKVICLATTLGGAVVGALLAFFITGSITKPIRVVAESLNLGADQTASAAGQVSSASQSLAEGASEQAASLEETSASLEEMSSMTKRNSENAQKANSLAREARTAADTSAENMRAMQGAMEAIKASSDDIAKIIKTIDEIAFQTNILALNAAVEAARAGEAGMGFAVVADEVRNLAQRCAESARETSAKIATAVSKASEGVEITGKVSDGLNEILSKVREVDQLIGEVACASKEQSQGISQVNVAISQMEKVTQSNAASAEESASASEQLNAQAKALKDAVIELRGLVDGSALAVNESPENRKPVMPAKLGSKIPEPPKAKVQPAECKVAVNTGMVRANAGSRNEIPMPSNGKFKDF